MSKATSYGKAYAAIIAGNLLRNSKSRGIKATAFNDYLAAKKKYLEEEKPIKDKAYLGKQTELASKKQERLLARKGKKAEKRKAKNQAKADKEMEAKLIEEQAKVEVAAKSADQVAASVLEAVPSATP